VAGGLGEGVGGAVEPARVGVGDVGPDERGGVGGPQPVAQPALGPLPGDRRPLPAWVPRVSSSRSARIRAVIAPRVSSAKAEMERSGTSGRPRSSPGSVVSEQAMRVHSRSATLSPAR
jgi:hypothetical protein